MRLLVGSAAKKGASWNDRPDCCTIASSRIAAMPNVGDGDFEVDGKRLLEGVILGVKLGDAPAASASMK